jgi:hypothetical protein
MLNKELGGYNALTLEHIMFYQKNTVMRRYGRDGFQLKQLLGCDSLRQSANSLNYFQLTKGPLFSWCCLYKILSTGPLNV